MIARGSVSAEQQARETEQRLHDQQQDRIARLTRMLQMQSGINAAVLRIRDREDLLREACRLALQVGGYEHAMISLVAPDGRHAEPWYRLGMQAEFPEKVEFSDRRWHRARYEPRRACPAHR